MKKAKLVYYIIWSLLNTAGLILGALAWKIAGDGLWLIIWCAAWEIYVIHKIFAVLEEN